MNRRPNMAKGLRTARPPEIVYVPEGIHPERAREYFSASGLALPDDRAPKPGLNVAYPDRRVMPRVCVRTGMRRDSCCCARCRKRRRRNHSAACSCWLCFSDRTGAYIDGLGGRTAAGGWRWFVTLTFRTKDFPWAHGFPIEQPEPQPDFVHHFFDRQMIPWIEKQVHVRVEYFVADQFGEAGGRLHLHCGLSWPALFEYRWKPLQEMLWKGAGFNRILPWEADAGYYIGRYIGRDARRCEWDFRVGDEPARVPADCGRSVVAVSPAVPNEGGFLSSAEYRRSMGRWHR